MPLRENKVFCGQRVPSDAEPPDINELPPASIKSGLDFVAVLTEDGTVYTKGSNTYGQLGIGSIGSWTTEEFQPVALE
jgi:alpha-tubulin suppressor-like RCC1 family protein